MANTEHSVLTGASLHEPKGVAAASASTVYLANGSGSGSWTTVPLAGLASTAKAFEAQLLHVREEQTQGTNTSQATIPASTWTTVTFNTSKTNEISGASLASNQVTLPSGTYWFEASWFTGTTFDQRGHLRLMNITDNSAIIYGQNVQADNYGMCFLPIRGRFTLSGSKVIELQVAQNAGTLTSPVTGAPTGLGTEVYADMCIWKVA